MSGTLVLQNAVLRRPGGVRVGDGGGGCAWGGMGAHSRSVGGVPSTTERIQPPERTQGRKTHGRHGVHVTQADWVHGGR
jgi:hypothetical protein